MRTTVEMTESRTMPVLANPLMSGGKESNPLLIADWSIHKEKTWFSLVKFAAIE